METYLVEDLIKDKKIINNLNFVKKVSLFNGNDSIAQAEGNHQFVNFYLKVLEYLATVKQLDIEKILPKYKKGPSANEKVIKGYSGQIIKVATGVGTTIKFGRLIDCFEELQKNEDISLYRFEIEFIESWGRKDNDAKAAPADGAPIDSSAEPAEEQFDESRDHSNGAVLPNSSAAKSEFSKNIILYGPPGTGKTYNTARYAVAICDGRTLKDVEKDDYADVMKRYKKLVSQGRAVFTTFHQSYGYEEFIEGIKPDINNNGDVIYKVQDGVFKEFCKDPFEGYDNSKNKVFIIDEINRGNISKIFGELITLIEESKRQGMEPEGASAILPYSKEEFSVPQNVYILGTMNTADRSIALIDTALRRRFDFIEMMPSENELEGVMVDGIDIKKMLKTINERIEALYDREHTIGHAFFMKLKDEPTPTLEMLASVFEKKIIPLLQEYFYDDYGKIQLVLGDNAKTDENYKFIKDETVDSSIFKGNTDISLPQKKYSINGEAFKKSEAYRQIYED